MSASLAVHPIAAAQGAEISGVDLSTPLAFRDNRCAQPNAINDSEGYHRLMYRITLAGDTPRGP